MAHSRAIEPRSDSKNRDCYRLARTKHHTDHPLAIADRTDTMPEIVHIPGLDSSPHANVFEENHPKTIRLALAEGQEVAPHSHPGTAIVCYVIDGSISISLDDNEYEVSKGDAIRFSGDSRVSPTALTDAMALLVFTPAEEDG